MSRRRLWVGLGLSVAALALILFWWLQPDAKERGAANAGPRASDVETPADARGARRDVPGDHGPNGAGAPAFVDPGSTPPLPAPFTEADGVLEVRVVAGSAQVPGAQVRVYSRFALDGSTGVTDWRFAGGGVTDARGVVPVFAGPGAYLVAARAQGFAPGYVEVVRPRGEARTRATVALTPGQALTGRTVARGSGEAVALADLVLTPMNVDAPDWQKATAPAEEQVRAQSDARGEFRVEGLSEGAWHIFAHAPGYARAEVRNVHVPAPRPVIIQLTAAAFLEGTVVQANGAPAPSAQVIVVGSEQQVVTTSDQGAFSVEVAPGVYNVSAKWQGQAGALADPVSVAAGKTKGGLRIQLQAGAVVEGTVTDKKTGAPLAGAMLSLSPHNAEGDSGRAVTGTDGRYRIEGVAPGAYDLQALAAGHTEEVMRGMALAGGQTFIADFQLLGTGAVEGTVTDEGGRPLQGARVRGGSRWTAAGFGGQAEVTTGADGRYRLDDLDEGRVTLSATRSGETLGITRRVEVKADETTRADFQLPATGVLSGKVVRESGQPIDFPVVVVVMPEDKARWNGRERAQVDVAADGTFSAELPAAAWSVGPRRLDKVNAWGWARKTVNVTAGQTAFVELVIAEEDPRGVAGVVVEPGGAPSSGAVVSVFIDGKPRQAFWTKEDGAFAFPSLPAGDASTGPGALALKASNGGRTGELPDVAWGSKDVVLQLKPAASVRGRVRSSSGAPVSRFTLTWQLVGPGAFYPGAMDPLEYVGDGFELRELPEGTVRLEAATPEGRRGTVEVTTRSGTQSVQDITLEPGAVVTARMVDGKTNQPLMDAWAAVDGAQPDFSRPSGADGKLTVELAPGSHTLKYFGTFRQPQTRTVSAVAGQPVDLGDVVLAPSKAEPGTIGARFNDLGQKTSFVWVLPDGPAAQAGIKDGDVLAAIDGVTVRDAQDAAERTRGAPGSSVQLTLRTASGAERSVAVVRAQ